MERLTRLVDGEMEAATLEHNEAAELEELAAHLSFELNRVIKRQVEITMAQENDEDDYALSTLPPTPPWPLTSDDDDEQDAEEDDSDHGEYDPWAFAEGH